MMNDVVERHDKPRFRCENIELGIDSLNENKDEVARYMVTLQRLKTTPQGEVASSHLILYDLTKKEVYKWLDTKAQMKV